MLVLNMLMLLAVPQQPVAIPPPDAVDWWLEAANAITLLTPALVRIMVWGAFFFVKRIPTWALSVAAVIIGVGYDAIDGLLWNAPILVAIKTFLMLGLREILDKYFTQPLGLKDKFTETIPVVGTSREVMVKA